MKFSEIQKINLFIYIMISSLQKKIKHILELERRVYPLSVKHKYLYLKLRVQQLTTFLLSPNHKTFKAQIYQNLVLVKSKVKKYSSRLSMIITITQTPGLSFQDYSKFFF